MRSPAARLVAAAAAVALAAACARPGPAAEPLTVLAAASLDAAFTRIAATFEDARPGVRVDVSFAGSHTLVTQLAAGVPADVLATADEVSMAAARQRGLVGPPRVFATNRLVIVTPAGNPAGVGAPADLGRPGVRLVLAGEEVPAGRYARRALGALGVAVEGNLVSEEEDVRGVVAKVATGEADAGVVYVTDVTGPAAGRLRTVPLPPSGEPVAYPIAVTTATSRPGLARAFVAAVTGEDGAAALRAAGFRPPSGGSP